MQICMDFFIANTEIFWDMCSGQVYWHTPLVYTIQDAEARGALEPWESGTSQGIQKDPNSLKNEQKR